MAESTGNMADQVATETSTALQNVKDFFIGDPVVAFVTGSVLGFALAYGLVTYCPQARKFLRIDENRGFENV